MDAGVLLREAIRMIPHWFSGGDDLGEEYHKSKLTIKDSPGGGVPSVPIEEPYYTTRSFRDDSLEETIEEVAESFLNSEIGSSPEYSRLDLELFSQRVVLKHLGKLDGKVKWRKLLDHEHALRDRTFENDPIVLNAILTSDCDHTGVSLFSKEDDVQKKLDPLASSLRTAFRVDKETMNICDFIQVPASERDMSGSHVYPSVFSQIVSVIGQEEYSFHRTRRGDVLVISDTGLEVSRRKGNWTIYNPIHLRDTVIDILDFSGTDSQKTANNTLDILLDLSYKRHGALIVFDPNNDVRENGIQDQSTIFEGSLDSPHNMLAESLTGPSLTTVEGAQGLRHMLLEAASLDGCVLLNGDGTVASCGTFISANEIEEGSGARTRAAIAAARHGGFPIKVSEDGQITLFSKTETGDVINIGFA